jgi:hypothetical protein
MVDRVGCRRSPSRSALCDDGMECRPGRCADDRPDWQLPKIVVPAMRRRGPVGLQTAGRERYPRWPCRRRFHQPWCMNRFKAQWRVGTIGRAARLREIRVSSRIALKLCGVVVGKARKIVGNDNRPFKRAASSRGGYV